MLNIIFMGNHHSFATESLQWLLRQNELFKICYCIIDGDGWAIEEICNEHKISIGTTAQLYQELTDGSLGRVDLGISCLYGKRIRQSLINYTRIGCINFHPAPLPAYRGVCSMCFGILDGIDYWEATAHFVDSEELDAGRVIDRVRINFDPDTVTVSNLEEKLYPLELDLFERVLLQVNQLGAMVPTTEIDVQKGKYFSAADYQFAQYIRPEDSPVLVERKTRAFWFPQNGKAASIIVGGQEFYIVNQSAMQQVKLWHNK